MRKPFVGRENQTVDILFPRGPKASTLNRCGMVFRRIPRLLAAMRLCGTVLLMAACCPAQDASAIKDLPAAPSATVAVLAQSETSSPQDNQQNTGNEGTDHPSMMHKVKDLPGQVKDLPAKMKDQPIIWLIGPYIPHETKLSPLTMRERREVYFRQTYFNAGAYFARAFAAGIDQARGIPYEWGGGIGGYGQRFASHFGQFMIQNTLVAGGNAALGYEPRYDICRCTGFWRRTRHAIVRNFVTYDSTETAIRPQVPLFAGAFSAGVIASTWKPGNHSVLDDGLRATLEQAGYGVAVNWVKEFALDILRKSGAKTPRN